MESDLKRDLEETCRELGMNLTTAFTVFARKVARERRIPFDVSIDPFYSAANLEHLRQVRADTETGTSMVYHDLVED
jgi:DNA-damage-inducible protein J